MKSITNDEFLALLDTNEDLYVIDVREDEEVAQGMIPGAQHIALGTIPERVQELDQSKPYIIVCREGGHVHKLVHT